MSNHCFWFFFADKTSMKIHKYFHPGSTPEEVAKNQQIARIEALTIAAEHFDCTEITMVKLSIADGEFKRVPQVKV